MILSFSLVLIRYGLEKKGVAMSKGAVVNVACIIVFWAIVSAVLGLMLAAILQPSIPLMTGWFWSFVGIYIGGGMCFGIPLIREQFF